MTVFMTKTWGFGSPTGPLQFSEKGWRDRARDQLKPGDLVVIVGTKGEETIEAERGRILGLMEPLRENVASLDYVVPAGPRDYTESGEYKWPFGLELLRAWSFDEPRTLLIEITTRQFAMDSALGIVPLLEPEAKRILALPRSRVELIRPFRTTVRLEGVASARRRAAPPPSTTRRSGIMHMRRMPAYTYAMAINGSRQNAFKIGWAFDWESRQRQFNQTALPELGGLSYRIFLTELWETASDAFRMEQALLRHFNSRRHANNVEVVTPLPNDELNTVWATCITRVRRRPKTAARVP